MKPSKTQVGGDHYKEMPIQPHYFCHTNKLGALESNVVKYVCRHSRKGGKADLLKARHYIDLLLEWQYDDDGQTSPADGRLPDHIDEIAALTRGMTTVHPLSVQEILAAKQLDEAQRVANLPPGWPYSQSGALDADLVGEQIEPGRNTASGLCKCGYAVCKICEFPAGTSYGGMCRQL